MKSTITLEARRFPVTVTRDGCSSTTETVILTKQQLQAAQLVGESSKELIQRIFSRAGFTVLDIGKPERKTIVADLAALWEV